VTHHPTEGVLRRLVDEPAGVAVLDRRHVAGCTTCLDDVASARQDAAVVAAALDVQLGDVDIDAEWQRFTAAAEARRAPRAPRAHGRRAGVRRQAVAAVAVAAVLAGAGAAAAFDWLPIFRTERIVPVGFRTADLLALPDLDAYGDIEVTAAPDVRRVADAATAAAATGLDVPDVTTLPRGVSGEPVYEVGDEVSAVFTFSAERAADAAADAGATLPTPPPDLDGSQVRLVAGPGVAAIWSPRGGVPSLVVARAVAPTAFSTGVPFETVRDYLLSIPGLPDGVATQLRAFAADGDTLPLPVHTDRFTTSSADVDGARATVLTTPDRTLAAVVWVEDGIVHAVAGPLDADEVLTVARGLR